MSPEARQAHAKKLQAVRADAMFSLVENPAIQPIAGDVDARLQRVFAAL